MIEKFWLLLTVVCVIWYIVILLLVIVKGAAEIKVMLRNLTESSKE